MPELDPVRRELQEKLLGEDFEVAEGFAEAARAENTLRAYRSDWEDFQRWCSERGLSALPATTGTVALYVASRAKKGPDGDREGALKVSTLRRRLSAISQVHSRAGYENPASTREDPLHSIWTGLVRKKTLEKEKVAPVLLEDLRATIEMLPREDGELTMLALRDRALLLVG